MDKADFAVLLAPIGKLYHMSVPRLTEYADGLFYALGDSDPELLKKGITKLLKNAGHYVPKPDAIRAAMAEAARALNPPKEASRAGPVKCAACGDTGWIDCYLQKGDRVVQMVKPCTCTPKQFYAPHNGWEEIEERSFWNQLGPHQLTTWLKASALTTAYQSGDISRAAATDIVARASNPKPDEDPFAGITPFTDEEAT